APIRAYSHAIPRTCAPCSGRPPPLTSTTQVLLSHYQYNYFIRTSDKRTSGRLHSRAQDSSQTSTGPCAHKEEDNAPRARTRVRTRRLENHSSPIFPIGFLGSLTRVIEAIRNTTYGLGSSPHKEEDSCKSLFVIGLASTLVCTSAPVYSLRSPASS